ncbi:MAG: Ger(x)C family spore germination C-terminal domain-containing protein [Evtepia sp.]
MRILWIVLLCSGLLSACSSPLPTAREPDHVVIASVLLVENNSLRAVVEGRNGARPQRYAASAKTLSGAIENTRSEGIENVSYAHIEHILLSEEAAQNGQLDRILSFAFRESEQSTETNLWILRDAIHLPAAFDLAKRMDTLAHKGNSLRETAAQWADSNTAMIPTLRWDGQHLVLDGYALFKDQKLITCVPESEGRILQLLAGQSVSWVAESENGEAMQLESKYTKIKPIWQRGILSGIAIDCRLEGKYTESWEEGKPTWIENALQSEFERTISHLAALNLDAAQICRRIGLTEPWQWTNIKNQWQMNNLACRAEVSVSVP